MHLPRPFVALTLAAALAVGPVACGGSSDSTSSGPTTTAAADGASTPAGSDPSTAEVSANDASKDEITAALEAAGVTNADRWADEVTEYRPYPADDPDLTKLQDELQKYNPGQETIDQIVGALQP